MEGGQAGQRVKVSALTEACRERTGTRSTARACAAAHDRLMRAAWRSDAMSATTTSNAPFWVILSCALAISIGTYLGGWRVIRTLGKGLVEIEAPQGMAAESSSAAIILLSASFGYSLSTTHVATGSIIGTGLGKKGADVRWNVAGRMATAWVFTLPSAGVVGALSYWLAHGIGGSTGVIILLIILAALAGTIYWRSRATKVDHNNVNNEWSGGVAPAEPEPATAA